MTAEIIFGIEKGEVCNRDGCAGIIDEHETETSCSCHINPPCSHCVTDRHYCPACGWEGVDEQQDRSQISETQKAYYESENRKWKEARELFYKKFNGKETIDKLEMRTEGHTHFSQIVVGVFPKGTETRASILPKVNGTFGGRFEHFGEYNFKFIAYTD